MAYRNVDRDRDILRLAADGVAHAKIAAMFGISSKRIQEIVADDPAAETRRNEAIQAIIRTHGAEIAKLKRRRKTITNIATALGLRKDLVIASWDLIRPDRPQYSRQPEPTATKARMCRDCGKIIRNGNWWWCGACHQRRKVAACGDIGEE